MLIAYEISSMFQSVDAAVRTRVSTCSCASLMEPVSTLSPLFRVSKIMFEASITSIQLDKISIRRLSEQVLVGKLCWFAFEVVGNRRCAEPSKGLISNKRQRYFITILDKARDP